VYWDIAAAPDVLGVAVGAFTDPAFSFGWMSTRGQRQRVED
jgi:hypothetical protein